MRDSTGWALILGGILMSAAPAAGTDQPIAGKRLVVQVGPMEKLVFVSKDPAFLFPAPGSPDDPGTGTPGGALVEVFSPDESPVTFAIPPGVGMPGWTTRTGAMPSHRWRNPGAPGGPSPVKSARLKQGKTLSLTARVAGLALVAPATRIAIRVTTGSLRSCAVFEGASIRTTIAGRFVATNAPAPALADCSDASLLGLPACADASYPTCGGGCAAGETCVPDGFSSVCHCVSPSMPCGQTNPTCNGECPAGEACASFGFASPFNTCGCIPTGSTPCGTPGAPVCGGTCPAGTACSGLFPPLALGGGIVCGCNGPGMSCQNGFAFGGAPEEGFPFMCYPILCTGTYPTCGGGCLDGGLCSAIAVDVASVTLCICAAPLPCGAGGYDCPAGSVCHFPVSGTPSCGPP
jgi:hypothetical protein